MVYLTIYGVFYLMKYSNYFCRDYFNADWIVFLPFSQSLQSDSISFILVRFFIIERLFSIAAACFGNIYILPSLTKCSPLLLTQRLSDYSSRCVMTLMISVILKTVSVSLSLKQPPLWLYSSFQWLNFRELVNKKGVTPAAIDSFGFWKLLLIDLENFVNAMWSFIVWK